MTDPGRDRQSGVTDGRHTLDQDERRGLENMFRARPRNYPRASSSSARRVASLVFLIPGRGHAEQCSSWPLLFLIDSVVARTRKRAVATVLALALPVAA